MHPASVDGEVTSLVRNHELRIRNLGVGENFYALLACLLFRHLAPEESCLCTLRADVNPRHARGPDVQFGLVSPTSSSTFLGVRHLVRFGLSRGSRRPVRSGSSSLSCADPRQCKMHPVIIFAPPEGPGPRRATESPPSYTSSPLLREVKRFTMDRPGPLQLNWTSGLRE